MSKSLSIIGRGISALALSVSGLAIFAGAASASATVGAPTSVAISGTSAGAVTVSWVNPASTSSAITSYQITTGSTPTVLATSTTLGAAGAANSYTWTPTTAIAGAIHVVAVGADGTSTADAGSVTAAVLAAPTIGTATAGNGTITVAFTQAAADHSGQTLVATGANIYNSVTGALVCTTTALGAWDGTSAYAASSCVVNAASAGLSVGTGSSYTFTAKMINAAGLSTASSASTAVVAGTSPTAPTGVTAALDNANGNVNLSWTAPSSNGGSALTYTITNGAGTSVTATVTGTTATATYNQAAIAASASYNGYFTVTATNGQGLTSSANSNTIFVGRTPAVVAGVSVSISGTTATVAWTAAASSGATAVSGYSVQLYTCTSGTWSTTTCTASGSPKLVAGGSAATTTFTVAPGTYYAATVAAVNGSGTGVAGTSTPVQFANAAPGTPVVSVTGKTNSTLSISWTSAANGAAVSATSVQLYKQATVAASSTSTDGTSAVVVTFAAQATAPLVGSTLYVTEAGADVTSCTITASTTTSASCASYAHPSVLTADGAKIMLASGTAIAAATATTYTFTSLASGIYSATVTTTNSVGISTASAQSTPTQVNVAPTVATLTYTSTSAATISWTAATSTTVATSTVVDSTTGLTVCTATGTAVSCTITAAQAAAALGHTFKVYTTDASGMPTALSGATAAIAAAGAAGTPTAYGNASGVSLIWTAGSNANSYNIVGYPIDGSSPVTATSATTSYLFAASALKTGITYTFKIQSVNAAGSSAYGTASSAAGLADATAVANAPTVSAITSVAYTNGNGIKYTWTAGAAVTGNAVTSYVGTLTEADGTILTCTTTALTCVFAPVVPGQKLSFTVRAVAPLGNSVESTALVTYANNADSVTAGNSSSTDAGLFNHPASGPVTGVTANNSAALAALGTPAVLSTDDKAGTAVYVTWTAPTTNASYYSAYQITFTNTTAGTTQRPFYCSTSTLAGFGLVDFNKTSLDCGATGSNLNYTVNADGTSATAGSATATFNKGDSYSVTVAAISLTAPLAYAVAMPGQGGATYAQVMVTLVGGGILGNAGKTGMLGSTTATPLSSVNGQSLGNASATVTTPTFPGTPTGVTASASGNNKVTVSFTAPAVTGGSAITGYKISVAQDAAADATTIATGSSSCTPTDATSTSTSSVAAEADHVIVITTTGTATSWDCTVGGTLDALTVTVEASTPAGDSTTASTGVVVTPAATPGTPTAYYGGSVGSAITIGWAAVTPAATSYTVKFSDTTPDGTTTVTTTTGITTTSWTAPASLSAVGDSFSVTVTAVNSAGSGTAGTATQASLPGTPGSFANYQHGTSAAPTDTNLTWTASSASSLPVTYSIYATINGIVTQIGTTTGLTFSETYNSTHTALTVCATTARGTSATCASSPTTYVGAGAPSAVTSLSAGTPSATAATLSWTDGATGTTTPPVTSYTVSVTGSDGTTPACTFAAATDVTCTLVLLPNVAYTASVVENTWFGSSIATTKQFNTPLSAAGAPTVTSVTATDTTMTFAWTAPTSLGGASSVNSYLVTVTQTGGNTASCVTASTTCVVSGLAGSITAANTTFAVTPYTSFGAGTAATTFGTLTGVATLDPAASPNGVTILTTGLNKPTYPAFGSMTINWTVGAANASPVTGFVCQAVDGTAVNATITVNAAATATSCTFTGMANVAYTVTVHALSAFSTTDSTTGVASTNSITSNTWVNDAPARFGGLSAVSGTYSVVWAAPFIGLTTNSSNSAVGSVTDNLVPTSYTANASLTLGGAAVASKTCATSSTTAPCTITGLTAGGTYYITVVATTAAGTSTVTMSSRVTVLSATAPAAPTNVAATRNATGLAITWTAPASVGSGQLVGYWVTATDLLTTQQYSCPYNATYGLLLAPATSCSIAGLSVGSTYKISITAISQDGAGTKQLSAAGTETGVLYNVLAPEPVMATFLAVTAKQKSVSALSPAAKTALTGLISSTNDGAQITIAGYGTTKAIALARANAAASYLFNNGAAVHVTIQSVISKKIKTALVTVTSN